jgi:hypothetical protein
MLVVAHFQSVGVTVEEKCGGYKFLCCTAKWEE